MEALVGGLPLWRFLGDDRTMNGLSEGRLFTVVPSRHKAPRPVLALGRGGFLLGEDK
jgi:hypothetical protein